MNERIRELAEQAGYKPLSPQSFADELNEVFLEKFAELLKQAIYDEVKEELVDDKDINSEPDIEDRCYLRGCNGGIVDALCIIRNFGVDEDE